MILPRSAISSATPNGILGEMQAAVGNVGILAVFHGPPSATRCSYRDSGSQIAFAKTKVLHVRGGEGIVQLEVFATVGEECSGEANSLPSAFRRALRLFCNMKPDADVTLMVIRTIIAITTDSIPMPDAYPASFLPVCEPRHRPSCRPGLCPLLFRTPSRISHIGSLQAQRAAQTRW